MKNMKKLISLFIVCLMLLSTVAFADGNVVYVSPTGSLTDGDGTEANPFATLEAAKEAVSGSTGATVIFKDGKYRFSQKVTFTEADSGVTYKAEDGAEVVFTGAVPLNRQLFTNVKNPDVLAKLPASSRSKVLMLDLTKQGITISGEYPALYVNDSQATIARYPNEGYAVATNANKTATFDTGYANVANWSEASLKNAVLAGSITSGYTWNKTTIASVSGTEVTLADSIRNGAYYYVRNLIEELDAPGEYIISDNILYYYPQAELAELDMEIVNFTDSSMIELDGAENITFDGIKFEKANSSAITTASKYTNNVTIKNCEFKYIIKQVLDIRGYNHLVSDNYAYGCGNRFIYISGGNKEGLVPGNIKVTNNRIVGCGNWSPASTGVIKGGIDTWENWICIGNEVSNNIIQDCYTFAAINVTGNDNKIQYNEIINMGRIIEDGGAIYSGKSATKYGTVVSHNYIHDFDLDNDYCALYSDDGMSGLTMEYNVVERVSKAMVSGLGANNNFSNNLFIDVSRGMGLGTRMLWDASVYNGEGKLYKEAYDIVYNENSEISDAYNAKYREIKEMVDAHINKGYPFFAPWNTVVKGNVMISDDGSIKTIASRPYHSLKTSSADNAEYRVDGEEEMYTANKIVLKDDTTNTVDELATYSVKATDEENPYYAKNTDEANDAIAKIDLAEIGISNNETILAQRDEAVKLTAVSYDADSATITWEPVENASEFDIVITKDGSAYKEDTCYNIFHTNKYSFDLNGAGTYAVTVTAKGLSRQDNFTVTGTTSFTVGAVLTANLENALSVLKDTIDAGYKNTDDTLQSVYDTNSKALSSADQSEIDAAEAEVYEAIKAAASSAEAEVTRFEADQNSTIVYVEAVGFPANSLATVMVTNPDVAFDDAVAAPSTEKIRFVATVPVDELGKVKVEFDTSENEIDYEGVYKLYVKANDDSTIIEKEYTYGTVEVSDVTFKSGETVIENEASLVNYAGNTVTLSMKVNNRLSRALTPEAYLGIYDGKALKSAFVQNATTVSANSEGTVEITVELPSSYNADCELKLFMWDDGESLRPLTTTRFIFEN